MDDAYWMSINLINDDCELLYGSISTITWWSISDIDFNLIIICKNMAKMLCRVSLLTSDDYRVPQTGCASRVILCLLTHFIFSPILRNFGTLVDLLRIQVHTKFQFIIIHINALQRFLDHLKKFDFGTQTIL